MRAKQPRLTILWRNQTNQKVLTSEIKSHLNSVLRHLGLVGRLEVEILIAGDKKIQRLNSTFRGVNEATDVLSFPLEDQLAQDFQKSLSPKSRYIGSIAVSVNFAARQARQAGINVFDQLKMLCSHGMLHLLGFHHR